MVQADRSTSAAPASADINASLSWQKEQRLTGLCCQPETTLTSRLRPLLPALRKYTTLLWNLGLRLSG